MYCDGVGVEVGVGVGVGVGVRGVEPPPPHAAKVKTTIAHMLAVEEKRFILPFATQRQY